MAKPPTNHWSKLQTTDMYFCHITVIYYRMNSFSLFFVYVFWKRRSTLLPQSCTKEALTGDSRSYSIETQNWSHICSEDHHIFFLAIYSHTWAPNATLGIKGSHSPTIIIKITKILQRKQTHHHIDGDEKRVLFADDSAVFLSCSWIWGGILKRPADVLACSCGPACVSEWTCLCSVLAAWNLHEEKGGRLQWKMKIKAFFCWSLSVLKLETLRFSQQKSILNTRRISW